MIPETRETIENGIAKEVPDIHKRLQDYLRNEVDTNYLETENNSKTMTDRLSLLVKDWSQRYGQQLNEKQCYNIASNAVSTFINNRKDKENNMRDTIEVFGKPRFNK